MPGSCRKIRIAAVQAAPVNLNLEAASEKICSIIDEAAQKGVKLIAFPEAFLSGFSLQKISNCAQNNKVYVCVPYIERDKNSCYLTQLWFNPGGSLMGKHRMFGQNNDETIPCFETEIGNIGGLICSENIEPVYIDAMKSMNEQIHVASWPAFFAGSECKHSSDRNVAACMVYAIATQSFVITNGFEIGGALVIGPTGKIISDQIPCNEEGIVYAHVNFEEIKKIKYAGKSSSQRISGCIKTFL
jgi:cyanide dihydratase